MLIPNQGPEALVHNAMEKEKEKKQISNVIAPEHDKRHHNHENELKNEEKALINQMVSHTQSFRGNFEGVAKGDWVESAMSELDKINNELKKIADGF
ncbi:hypothetical protein ABH521_006765 [Staphylococcus warneri]|uniref:hypothetical protein n=1 Tax=Staphylococcus warneri TaxID=1292 RepID=UPI003260DAF6